MKVLIISDLTLEVLSKNQLLHSKINYTFLFSEDISIELQGLIEDKSYDLVCIYFDGLFKKYRKEFISLLLNSLISFSNKTRKNIVVSNLFFTGWSEVSLVESFGAFTSSLNDNESQIEVLRKMQNVYFLDVDNLIRNIGIFQTYNYPLGHLYQMPYTKLFLDNLASLLEKTCDKIVSPDKKVIILDCDNTLWGGIVGEDGVDKLLCDLNADGITYYHFQQFLKSRKSIGFLLCLCSKNNEEEVKEVFLKKRMPLNWDDFVVRKVNWYDKDCNIKEIANELNLGTDSFIFIDDNDFELNIVKESLPQVTVFRMTPDYANFTELIQDLDFFKKSITQEDLSKTEQYKNEVKRKVFEGKSLNFEEYRKSLEIVISIHENILGDLIRVAQLTEKTNQFNFNKKFYSVEELNQNISSGVFKCFTLRVSDKFGDYGLVGVIIIEIKNDKTILENFILSCRILGRRVEFDFLNGVQKILESVNNRRIDEFRFRITSKNIPAQNFYQEIIKTK